MPKVYLTTEERECNRFSDFVRGELRRQGKFHKDLANELNLSTVAVTQRINGKTRWTLPEIIQTLCFLKSEYTFNG